MNITIPEIIILIVVACAGCFVAFLSLKKDEYGDRWSVKFGLFILCVTCAVCVSCPFILNWWHSNTASGARSMKEYKSEFNNGVYREITITAEDGREIFHYEGKIDIETSHENSENYILFESEEGMRYIIYYGVQDTVLIIEKEENE